MVEPLSRGGSFIVRVKPQITDGHRVSLLPVACYTGYVFFLLRLMLPASASFFCSFREKGHIARCFESNIVYVRLFFPVCGRLFHKKV